MTTSTEATKLCPIATIGTTLIRARCCQPARTERMKQSLATHGQLTPLVAAARPEGVELIDGFKRLAAATMLGWTTLLVTVRPLDETGQWAAMLLLNGGRSSMTTLEESLVLRELVVTGLTQIEIAELCTRHKTWVSRRMGLVERLHPELVEAMKLGLIHPGSARRLLSLPPGNQLEMAAAIQSARLGPRDTELLVGPVAPDEGPGGAASAAARRRGRAWRSITRRRGARLWIRACRPRASGCAAACIGSRRRRWRRAVGCARRRRTKDPRRSWTRTCGGPPRRPLGS